MGRLPPSRCPIGCRSRRMGTGEAPRASAREHHHCPSRTPTAHTKAGCSSPYFGSVSISANQPSGNSSPGWGGAFGARVRRRLRSPGLDLAPRRSKKSASFNEAGNLNGYLSRVILLMLAFSSRPPWAPRLPCQVQAPLCTASGQPSVRGGLQQA